MKKIMMTKYGFVRWPEKDFTDDCSRFTCYRVGNRVRVSKCIYNGHAYISASIDGTRLPYEVYHKLPHYSALDKLNGVAISSLTDNDLYDLVEACMYYEKEYTDAEDALVLPALNEIKAQCELVRAKANWELAEINQRFSLALAGKLTDWEWMEVRKYLLAMEARVVTFDPERYPQTILGTCRSVSFCKPDCAELQDSFYYKWIMEKIYK